MIDIFDIENLPDELELVDDLHIFGSNWHRKKGDTVPVSYNLTEEFWGKLSGNYYPPKVITINITDCEYPVEFYPICFKTKDYA